MKVKPTRGGGTLTTEYFTQSSTLYVTETTRDAQGNVEDVVLITYNEANRAVFSGKDVEKLVGAVCPGSPPTGTA